MEDSNESQDQMPISSTLTASSERPGPVENDHVEFSEHSYAATASGSNERVPDQAPNVPADGIVGDVNCEVDTEIRQQGSQVDRNQPPVHSRHKPTTNEDLSSNQAQGEGKSQYYCGICLKNVQTSSCCQRTAHKDCLYACGWSLTNCNCFQRERTIHRSDYPAPSTSSSKQPSVNDDDSGTWEDHPLQTFPHHSEILSLFCEICEEEEVFIKSLCCQSEYHWHCLDQYRKRGYTTCIYCRLSMQFSQQMNDLLRTLWGGGDDSASSGGGRGVGGRGRRGEGGGEGGGHDGYGGGDSAGGDDGGREGDIDGENDGGGSDSQGESGGRRRSGSTEGDEGDGGGGRDDDGGSGDDYKGGGVDDEVGGVDDDVGQDDDGGGGVDDGVGGVDDGVGQDDDGGGGVNDGVGGVDDGVGGVDDGVGGVDDGVGQDDDGGGGVDDGVGGVDEVVELIRILTTT